MRGERSRCRAIVSSLMIEGLSIQFPDGVEYIAWLDV